MNVRPGLPLSGWYASAKVPERHGKVCGAGKIMSGDLGGAIGQVKGNAEDTLYSRGGNES